MARLYFLSYSEFFYSFSSFFVHYSVIYHCFPPTTYIGISSFFVPLFVPVQYLLSIFFDPFHHSTLSLDFLFPSPLSSSQFLAPFSPIHPLKSPPKSIQISFIASSTLLPVVFISLLYIVIISHHLLSI
jgi:hypothetical protein